MKNFTISFIATFLIQMITMIQGMVSARWLLPLGKGELTTIMLWPSIFVSFGILGIQDAVAFLPQKQMPWVQEKF